MDEYRDMDPTKVMPVGKSIGNKSSVNVLRITSKNTKLFKKQQVAIDFSAKYGLLPIFGKDAGYKGNEACKQYLVRGYELFWETYIGMKPSERSFYEILRSGFPCHMHIDFEAKYKHNPGFDGENVEKGLFQYIDRELKELGFIKDGETYEKKILESSNTNKYSKHLSIKIPGKMFKNNFHVGAFMRRVESMTWEDYPSKRANPYYVRDCTNTGIEVLNFVADMNIYTEWRNWRIYASSKQEGGYRPMLTMGEDREALLKNPMMISRDIFFSHLIQYIDPENPPKELLGCLELDGNEPVSMGKKMIKIASIDEQNLETPKRKAPAALGQASGGVKIQKTLDGSKFGFVPPFLEKIGKEIVNEWKEDLKLTFNYYDRQRRVVYFDSLSHSCRMKREFTKNPQDRHVNHIRFVVYLESGKYVQGCFSNNDSCSRWIEMEDGVQKQIHRYTQDYHLSPDLVSQIQKYFSDLENGPEFSLAKTIADIYQLHLSIPLDER